MKTKNQLQKLQSLVKIVLISLTLIVSSLNSFAQNPFVSFEIARDVSGSGLGGNVCPSIALTYKNNALSIGPNFQRKKMSFSGLQANYRYSVATSDNGKRELYLSGNLTFHTSAKMSSSNIDIEKSCHPEEETRNYEELRLRVIEGYTGIGFKINPTKNFSTGFSAGMGVFNTLNKNYDRGMYREKSAVVLQVRFVIIYNFKKV